MAHLKLDLHVHTIYSKDAFIKPESLLDALISEGLDGCAICDHGNLNAYEFLKPKGLQKNLILIGIMRIYIN